MTEFLQHLINGLSFGSIYALVALGYTMVFGILKFINFAHGDVYMLGAFGGYYFTRNFHLDQYNSPWALLLVLILTMITCGLVGFLIETLAYKPLRNAPRINILITAVGVSLLLEYSGQVVFGAEPKFFPQLYQPEGQWQWAGLTINPLQVVVLVISLVLMGILQYVVFNTRTGRAMRAVSYQHDLASLMGIPVNRVVSITFILGSALAGAAGILVGLTYPKIEPLMGVMPGLKAFVSAVLGGIGNIQGAVLGALILGISEEMVVGYWAPTYRDALAFAILIVFLLVRPAGILGKNTPEKV